MPKQPPVNNPVTGDEAPPAGGAFGMEVGLMLVVAVLGLGALGLVIDQMMGWGPWLMLLGGFAGFGGWLVQVARRKG